jgi:TatD DNase family protein
MKMDVIDIHTHLKTASPCEVICNLTPDEIDGRGEGFFSVGIHPWHIDEGNLEEQWTKVVKAASCADVVALGETGLDKLCATPMELQQRVFERHIALSENVRKPLVIHLVKSVDELLACRRSLRPQMPWIIHGFRGGEVLAQQLVRHGLWLSFGEHYSEEALCAVPEEALFLETDESIVDIRSLYQRAALLRSESVSDFTEHLQDNIRKVFFAHY